MQTAKAEIAELSRTRFQNILLTIQRTSYTSKKGGVVEQFGVCTASGNLLGLITPDGETQIVGE